MADQNEQSTKQGEAAEAAEPDTQAEDQGGVKPEAEAEPAPEQPAEPPIPERPIPEPPAPAAAGGEASPSLMSQVLFPVHDPEMAGSNYYIDRRAWVLAVGVLGAILLATWLVNWVIGWNMPADVPKVVVDASTFSKGQLELVKEVNRQLQAWLYLSNNYEILAMVMGASAAALTVLVGFIKEHTKSKMFLMAMSAALSVFIGTVNPAEKATRFLNSWRVLYAEVNVTNAKDKLGEADFNKLATALSTAESALSQRPEMIETSKDNNGGTPPAGKPAGQ